MINNKLSKETKTKNKVWIALLISLFFTLLISYFSYQSFSKLTASIHDLSSPNDKIEILNNTFTYIVEGENNIKSFILTGDSTSEKLYRKQIKSAKENIIFLKNSFAGMPEQIKMVDSLQNLFEKKLQYLEAFLKTKNENQNSFFTSEALIQISKTLDDTLVDEQHLLTREFIKGKLLPVEKEEIVVTPDDYRGVKGFFRKILGGDNTSIDTLTTTEEQLHFTKEIRIDTNVIKNPRHDSTLHKVVNILNPIIVKEKKLQQKLAKKELLLLQQDRIFISNIKSIIDYLRSEEKLKVTHQNIQTTLTANQSTRFILLSGLFGVLMSGILLFLVIRDITNANFYRKQLEIEKNRAEKLAHIKETFLSSMSHEIRTPLQSIQGFSSLMANTSLNTQQQQYLQAINYSNLYLSELVNDVLDQSKINAGKLHLTKAPFDISLMIQELTSVFSFHAKQKNIALQTHFSQELNHIDLIGDGLRIKQILTNLLSNAIKFTHQGSVKLDIALKNKSQNQYNCIFTVTDTGIGIPENMHQHIFEPFSQSSPSIVKNYGGTGLGLSISKKLVELMNGEITLESTPNKGSVFTVSLTLPYATKSTQPTQNKVFSTEKETFYNAEIVVVEDDQWNSILIKEILNKHTQTVHLFPNPIKAISFLENHAVDLIFTDIKMPEMNGYEFLQHLRKNNISTPVVALSANTHLQQWIHEFNHICPKPYTISDIEKILDTFLQHKKQNAENNNPLPDVSFIQNFSGNDPKDFLELLQQFTQEHEKQITLFGKLIKDKNITELGELSHKLKPVYEQLKLHKLSESLSSIELYIQLKNHTRAEEEAILIYPDLQKSLLQLQAIVLSFEL